MALVSADYQCVNEPQYMVTEQGQVANREMACNLVARGREDRVSKECQTFTKLGKLVQARKINDRGHEYQTHKQSAETGSSAKQNRVNDYDVYTHNTDGSTREDEVASHQIHQVFHGREEILSEVNKYLDNPTNNKPLVLYGEPGSGKSSLIARATKSIVYRRRKSSFYQSTNFNKTVTPSFQPVLILRFIGTTPRSSRTLSLFQDICEQLYFLFKTILITYSEIGDEIFRNLIEKIENGKLCEEPGQIVQYFLKLIRYISLSIGYTKQKNSELKISQQNDDMKPLVYIFLDSIDQLHDNYNDDVIQRIMNILPTRIRIVMSVLPMNRPEQMPYQIEVTNLGHSLGMTVIDQWLKSCNKGLTDLQWQLVSDAFEKCSLPLFVKLVQDEITSWSSFSGAKQTTLCDSIQQSIHKLFQRIEVTHGRILVERALSYITASRTGLSESELEDILSIDEVVLNDVYQYHLPPVRRVPPLLWTRIRADLSEYVTERESDGSHVVYWYHQQFIDIVRERYFTNYKFTVAIHSNLSDFFSGRWAGMLKPFKYDEIHRLRFNLNTLQSQSDRLVSLQPLVWDEIVNVDYSSKPENKATKRKSRKVTGSKHPVSVPVKRRSSLGRNAVKTTNEIRYNYRRLNELPFHLLKSKRKEELFESCLFNFTFLYTKICALPLHVTLTDFGMVIVDIDSVQDIDSIQCQILLDCLRLSSNNIASKPDNLGPQVVGRLFPYIEEMFWIRLLVNQIQFAKDCLNKCALVPLYSYLHTPGGALDFSFDGLHQFPSYAIRILQSKRYLVSASNKIFVHNLSNGELICNAPIKDIKSGTVIRSMKFITGESHVLFCCTNGGQLIKYDIDSSDTYLWNSKDLLAENSTVSGFSVSNTAIILWFSDEECMKNYIYKYDIETLKPISRVDTIISNDFADNNVVLEIESLSNGGELIIVTKVVHNLDERYLEIFVVSNNSLSFFQKCRCGYFFNSTNSTISVIMPLENDCIKILRYANQENKFNYRFPNVKDAVLGLNTSSDDDLVIVTLSFGFRLWSLKSNDKKGKTLTLPQSVVNVPTKNQFSSFLQFTDDLQFLLAAVKHFLILYKLTDTTDKVAPYKVIPAHYGRILNLQPIVDKSQVKFITSSMDKTVKVWNISSVFVRDVRDVHKMERTIEGISCPIQVTNRFPLVLTYTRSSAALWNLESGEITESFTTSPNSLLINCHLLIDAKSVKVIITETKVLSVYITENEVKNGQRYDCLEDSENVSSAHVDDSNILIVCVKSNTESVVTCNLYSVTHDLPLISTFIYLTCLKCISLSPILSRHKKFLYFMDSKSMEISKSIGQYSLEEFKISKKIKIKKDVSSEIDLGNFELIAIDSVTDNQIAMVNTCGDYGYIYDFKVNKCLKKIGVWSGPNGNLQIDGEIAQTIFIGLYLPTRGGLDVVNLKTKKVHHTLIPRVSEGLYKSYGIITESGKYVIYYRESKPIISIFRLSDGKSLAKVNLQSEIKTISTTTSSVYPKQNVLHTNYRAATNDLVFIGCSDGALISMAIMDPANCIE